MSSKKYSHIIWDFNGTILNDVEVGIKSANILLGRRNLPLLKSREQYQSVFGFPIIDYYKRLGFDFNKESFDDLAVEWVDIYMSLEKHATVFNGVKEKLLEFKNSGYHQIILSATELNMLKGQLDRLEIGDYFENILGLDNIHAFSKVEIGKEWIKKEKPHKAVFIGDTVHDSETANAMGVDCILIASGHQPYETLKQCNVPVLKTIGDLQFD